ncbi:MAG: hypothetical protein V3T98_00400 [Candidatus Paceibacterota bacterium]
MKDVTLAQGNQVLNLILQKKIPTEQLQKLLASGLVSDLLDANLENGVDRNVFRRLIGLMPLNTFIVTVNYDLSVEEAVKAGKYDSSNNNIMTKNFSSNRRGKTEAEITLIHFDSCMESEDVIREIDKQGFRLAELLELLAFGAKYPDVQRDFPIVALGSAWQIPDGVRRMPCLGRVAGERVLDLGWFGSGWRSDVRFAVLRK